MVEQTDEMTEMSAMEGPPPGTVLLDKYRVDWMLGVGGYGYVVKAQHLEHGGSVAIKIMREDREADPATIGRFEREGRVVVQLESEHVARVYDVGKLPSGAPYMVMELLDGADLRTLLERGPLPVRQAVDYILQACEALAEAHGRGIVHRDIKPGNLFLAKLPAKRSIVKVLDFGISKSARQYDKRLTQTQSILGTPAYMSPEQMRDPRNVDYATDIWALGAVLYELVEGQLPFDADNFAELVIAVSTSPMRPMQRGAELKPVLERCLAKDIGHRFANIAQLASALAPFGTPATSREYVARIYRLLGHTAPPDDEVGQPRFLPALTPPPPATTTSPRQRALGSETELLQTSSWTGETLAPKRPWLLISAIGALGVAAVVVVLAMRGGSSEDKELPVKIDQTVVKEPEPATTPVKPAPVVKQEPVVEQEPIARQEPVKREPVKPAFRKPVVVKKPEKPPEPATVKSTAAKNGICPNGKPLASYMDGRCPKS